MDVAEQFQWYFRLPQSARAVNHQGIVVSDSPQWRVRAAIRDWQAAFSQRHALHSVRFPREESLSMRIRRCKMIVLLMTLVVSGAMVLTQRISASGDDSVLDDQLSLALSRHGFTGTVGSSLEQRLGRRIDNQLADLGRNLF